jgi:hypothetical protein
MIYAKVIDGVLQKYPYSRSALAADYPSVSFGRYASDASLAEWGLCIVHPSAYSEFNRNTHKLIEHNPIFDGTNWVQQWEVVELSAEEIATVVDNAKSNIAYEVQNRLDTFAQSRNYDSIMAACTYATSTNTVFQAEGQRCVELRDAMWVAILSIFDAVSNNTRAIPAGIHEIESELPTLSWE